MKTVVFLNLVTTGLDSMADKIVSIEMKKIDMETKNVIDTFFQQFNTEGVELSEYTKLQTGLSAQDLILEPNFKEFASDINEFIGSCDLGGYNIQWHLSFLVQKMAECGINFDYRTRQIIDPYLIHKRYQSFDFENVYKVYTGKTFDPANDNKLNCIIDLIEAQQQQGLVMDEGDSDTFKTVIDVAGYFAKEFSSDGKYKIIVNFGKHKGKNFLDVDITYLQWMYNQSFPIDTKNVIEKLLAYRTARR